MEIPRVAKGQLVIPNIAIAVALAFGGLGMVGVFLDTAWHRTIGRDSFFVLPHLFIYCGGLGIWGAAVAAVAAATLGRASDFGGTVLALRRLQVPVGFGIAALGVLIVGAAAPIDVWWHWLYGKDALIWSFSHLMGHFGAGVTAIGLLFAVAGQAGRRVFRRMWLWRLAMLAVFVDLVHRALFVQAHYTMIPESRTPDLYPYLSSLLLPLVLVAAGRALGPLAPTLVSLGFLAVALTTDTILRAIEFDRYTVTPIVALPALVLTFLAIAVRRYRERAWFAIALGLVFTLVFTLVETLWMAHVVGHPWPLDRVLAGLPRSVLAGGLSGWVGWVLGGLLVVTATGKPVGSALGSTGRARWAVVVALGLTAAGLASTNRPQIFGPPMTVGELKLAPLPVFRYQDAVFWNVLFEDGWQSAARVQALSEGIIDGFPLPVGPAWCAPTAAALAADLPTVRFTMEVNGTPVDLAPYPLVRLPLREGQYCAWVGVASAFQRASQNRFVYTVEHRGLAGLARTHVELRVTFKDP